MKRLLTLYGFDQPPSLGDASDFLKVCGTTTKKAWVSPHIGDEAACLFPTQDAKVARMFSIFRHPVEREVSHFYYQKHNTWERNYDPTLLNQTMDEFVAGKAKGGERNWMSYMLKNMNKNKCDAATMMDNIKMLLKNYFIIGLISDLDESCSRFERAFGWTLTKEMAAIKESQLHTHTINAFPHPTLDASDPNWQKLADLNAEDMEIYAYAKQLFLEQSKHLPYENGLQSETGGAGPLQSSLHTEAKEAEATVMQTDADDCDAIIRGASDVEDAAATIMALSTKLAFKENALERLTAEYREDAAKIRKIHAAQTAKTN